MPKKIYKYNCACEKNIHLNQPHMFVLHVARCKICQEKLPGELLETLEPDLSKFRQSIAKRQAEAGKKAPLAQPVKVEQKAPPQVKPPEPKPKEPATKPLPVKPDEPVDLLDAKIRELPSIQGMAKTIGAMKAEVGRVLAQIKTQKEGQQEAFKSLGEKIELMLGVGLKSAKASEEGEAEDEPIETPVGKPVVNTQPKIPPAVSPQAIEPGIKGEHITMPSELLKEAEDIRRDQGGDSRLPLETERPVEKLAMREGEVKPEPAPVQEEKTVIPPVQEPGPATTPSMAGVPDLEGPEQIAAMEQYLSQQKEKLGMGQGGEMEAPREKGKIPFLGDIKEIATQGRAIIEAIRGGGKEEGSSLPKTTEELASKVLMQVVSGAASKKDPIEYLLDGMKVANESATGKKDPVQYLAEGMKLANANLANAIKIVSGKGDIGPSTEDIGAVVRKEIQKMITPATTEHLPTAETGG